MADSYSAAVRLLASRELSEHQLRQRLHKRGFQTPDIDEAIERAKASGAVDDRRVALAFARTQLKVKRHGRLRALRELEAIGVPREIAREAVAEVFGDADEPAMIAQALARRSKRTGALDPAERRRLHGYLIRQGFSPDAVIKALRTRDD